MVIASDSSRGVPRGVPGSSGRADDPRRAHPVALLQRVGERLTQATGGIALVSAPAGYGKSTQVALWAADDPRPVVWLDLEHADDDPSTMRTRLVAMLQTVVRTSRTDADLPPIDHTAIDVLGAARLFRLIEQPVVLVFDDFDTVHDPRTLEAFGTLAHECPSGSTVVLVSQHQPHVPLARTRVENRVTEISAVDLALTTDEARTIFESAGVAVDDARIDEYVDATEGWPVGLVLAARLLAGDATLTVEGFARDRSVAEWLHEEFLRAASPDDIDFLRRASVLDWMSGALCDDVLGRTDSGARLERLSRDLLLVVPLGRHDDVYRMHRLLREVLAADLERLDRPARRAIDRSASAWFEQHGDIDRAMQHALRSADAALVERLLISHGTAAHTQGRDAMVRRWLDQLEPQRISAKPALCLLEALTSIGLGEDDAARAWTRLGIVLSERAITDAEDTTTELELQVLNALLWLGPIGECLPGVSRAYEQLAPGVWHAGACQAIGVLSHALGLDDIAASRLEEGAAEARMAGAVTVRTICRALLAVILGERSDWAAATAMARDARELVRRSGLDDFPSLVVVTAISAHVEARAGDAVTARAEIMRTRRNLAYVSRIGAWANVEARLSLSHACLLLGDRAGAQVLVDEAEWYLHAQPDAVGSLARLQEVAQQLSIARGVLPVGPSSLTTAEVRVLHYLPTNLSLADIAARLYVSRNTVKSHAAAVYRKLGVVSRGEAVRIAREVGLLTPLDPTDEVETAWASRDLLES